ncbi:MAG TPA: SpoIID/LytB domain-containing protein, partial [Candidatus Ozemobacteraceae bacterium]|nr:SpoIID/LytB domain-containing protein [Candidatus Ozemobacteraceae bacterium]
MINIKVAQYATTIEFTADSGLVWDMNGKNGRISGADVAKVSGVLEKAAVKRYHVMTASARAVETEKLSRLESEWKALGFPARILTIGRPLLTADGKSVIHDGRLGMVEVGVYNTQSEAQALVDRLAAQGKSSWIYVEVVSRSQGRLALVVNGATVAEGRELYLVPEQTMLLKKVEYAVGYPWHGFADRTYRGKMTFRWGAEDAIDAVLNTPLETVLAGVVPSEISGNAAIGALQAQACAARGEILAKIGTRHIGEGFDTCSEQHCQVFSGESAMSIAVAQKIAPTRGYVLTAPSGGLI